MPTVEEYLSEYSQDRQDTFKKYSTKFEKASDNWDKLAQQFNNEIDEIQETKNLNRLKQYARWFEEIIEYGEIKSK